MRPRALEVALAMLECGWRPIPIREGEKKPLIRWSGFQRHAPTEKQVRRWFETWPDANLAILTGQASGVDVVDFDPGHAPWPSDGHELPTGCIVCTPRGGRHVYLKHTAGARCSAGKLAEGIDVRADGGYVLFPPSTVDGKAYTWATGGPDTIPEPPEWLKSELLTGSPLGGGKHRGCARALAASGKPFPVGTRHNALIRIAGLLIWMGLESNIIREILARIPCALPLSPKGIDDMADWAERKTGSDTLPLLCGNLSAILHFPRFQEALRECPSALKVAIVALEKGYDGRVFSMGVPDFEGLIPMDRTYYKATKALRAVSYTHLTLPTSDLV